MGYSNYGNNQNLVKLKTLEMKKVLVITYYWPPSGGGGVQRWLKFTKYLPEFGWEPIILTPLNPSIREKDESLELEVNQNLKVVKIPIWEPYGITSKFLNVQTIPKQGIVNEKHDKRISFLTWLRGNLLIPDTRIFWKKPAYKKALDIIKQENVDLIVTTGPPHSLHLIGLALKTNLNIKWVVDFRDPWADWDILDRLKLTKRSRKIHQELERRVLTTADEIVTVSKAWAQGLNKKYGKSVKVITNGFEKDDFRFNKKNDPGKFRISHFGLLNEFRNAPALWEALGELCESNDSFNDELEVFLAGNIDSSIFNQIKSITNLSDKINYVGYLSHGNLAKEYQETAVFLLISNKSKNAEGHIPGKLFEYLYSTRPILAISPLKGDVADIINNTNSGLVFEPDDKEPLKKAILSFYNSFVKKQSYQTQSDITIYERINLTRKLATCFSDLLEN